MPPQLPKVEGQKREKAAAPRNWHLGGELRALLRLAIPVVLSELAWMMMSVVDTIMVGRLSPEAIGAVGLSSALYYIPALFGAGLLLGLDTLVSQAYGRGDHAECRHWVMQGIYIVLLFSIPVMIIVQWIPALLPRWGTNPDVASQTAAYLRLLNWGTPWLLTYACFRRYLQGMHIVKPVTFALVSANLVNLAGNWLLIYGKFGLPQMGVRGSAFSTVLARVYMAGFLIAVAIWHEHKAGGSFFAQFPLPDKRRIMRILQLGGPAATQMIFEIGAFGGATVIAAKLSAESLAAHQIALNIASVTYMVPLGISAAAAVAVGHNIGAGDPARARRTGYLAIGVAVAFMAIMALLLILFPHSASFGFTVPGSPGHGDRSAIACLGCCFPDLRRHPDGYYRSSPRPRPHQSAHGSQLHRLLDHRAPTRILAVLHRKIGRVWRLDWPDHCAGFHRDAGVAGVEKKIQIGKSSCLARLRRSHLTQRTPGKWNWAAGGLT